jgi:DNA-binding GntR family transcriptional regulator
MNKENLKSEVYNYLKSAIINFKLLPGVKISDKEIALKMGISRTPVREALVRLSEQGLVRFHHNRGFKVRSFTPKDVDNLYTLRESLERLAVRQAITNLNNDRIQTLKSLVDKYLVIADTDNLIGLIESDEAFHDLIARYSENEQLINILQSLHGQIRISRRYDHLHKTNLQKTGEEHFQIIEQMAQGYTIQAEDSMSKHILKAKQNVLTFMIESKI